MDISNLSLAELRELERLLPKEIRRREQEEKVKVRKELEAFVQARGFSLSKSLANFRTRSSKRSFWKVKASRAPSRWQALAMP
jgi:hypothetical protein